MRAVPQVKERRQSWHEGVVRPGGPSGDGWNGREGGGLGGGGALPLPTAKIGLWIFLAVPTLLFSAVVSAYVVRMGMPDWRPLHLPGLLWVNTALMLLSSAALQGAWTAARRGRAAGVRAGLLAGGLLGMLFLTGQLVAWYKLQELGYFLAAGPASSFFYLLTALHGLHVLGGLVAWGRTTARVWRAAPGRAALGVQLCAVYWHFLLAVWLAIFGLMLFN